MLLTKMYIMLKSKIPSITNLATNASLNAKINEVKGEIPNITNLATTTTTTALTAFENKISNVSNLVKKHNTKIQKLVKLKIKLLLIMIMIHILLLKNLIS